MNPNVLIGISLPFIGTTLGSACVFFEALHNMYLPSVFILLHQRIFNCSICSIGVFCSLHLLHEHCYGNLGDYIKYTNLSIEIIY